MNAPGSLVVKVRPVYDRLKKNCSGIPGELDRGIRASTAFQNED